MEMQKELEKQSVEQEMDLIKTKTGLGSNEGGSSVQSKKVVRDH